MEERLKEKGLDIGDKLKDLLVDIFSEQESFSKVRNIDKASVKLRFRIMTKVKAEGNILNTQKYPEIKQNTISLVVPRHTQKDEELGHYSVLPIFTTKALQNSLKYLISNIC